MYSLEKGVIIYYCYLENRGALAKLYTPSKGQVVGGGEGIKMICGVLSPQRIVVLFCIKVIT